MPVAGINFPLDLGVINAPATTQSNDGGGTIVGNFFGGILDFGVAAASTVLEFNLRDREIDQNIRANTAIANLNAQSQATAAQTASSLAASNLPLILGGIAALVLVIVFVFAGRK